MGLNPPPNGMIDREDKSILHIGRRKFFLGEIIGTGTYSKVCAAVMRDQHQKPTFVACKIINKRQAGKEFVSKFLPRELRILRGVNHEHIVSVMDILEMNNNVYVIMSYCKYGDLLDYIRNRGMLSEQRSKLFFKQLVSAVVYLHDKEIAHRDLKCENIFLYGKNTLKLGDFGFARYCENDSRNRILSNTYCGSAAYAAPEIIEGAPYNPKMYDVWSLGCVLYIMITGQMPFDDSNIKKMLKFQKNRILFISIWCSLKYTHNLKELLTQLLEPDVTKRVTINRASKSKWLKEDLFKPLLLLGQNSKKYHPQR